MKSIVWLLQGNCFKVAEYEYHCMVVYKEIVSKLQNMKTIVWYIQGSCIKVAECQYHSLVVTRKLFQSCGISIPFYGSCKEIVSKSKNMNTIVF